MKMNKRDENEIRAILAHYGVQDLDAERKRVFINGDGDMVYMPSEATAGPETGQEPQQQDPSGGGTAATDPVEPSQPPTATGDATQPQQGGNTAVTDPTQVAPVQATVVEPQSEAITSGGGAVTTVKKPAAATPALRVLASPQGVSPQQATAQQAEADLRAWAEPRY